MMGSCGTGKGRSYRLKVESKCSMARVAGVQFVHDCSNPCTSKCGRSCPSVFQSRRGIDIRCNQSPSLAGGPLYTSAC